MKIKNSITDRENLTNLFKYLSKLNCNFKSVACYDSVGGMSPLTYLIESNFHANNEMEEEEVEDEDAITTFSLDGEIAGPLTALQEALRKTVK